MATVLKSADDHTDSAWRGFAPGTWQNRVNVRDFIQRNYTPYEGDGAFLQGATERTLGLWRKLGPLLAQEREKGILDVSQVPSSILAHDPGYIDKRQRDHRRTADGRAAEARDHALRRLARRRVEPRGVRLQAGRTSRRDLHQVPPDAQRRRVRRVHAGDPQGALIGNRHRPARRLRTRPHHRRLPPGRPIRRGFPDRRQEAREARSRRPAFDRGHHPLARGALRADPLAGRAEGDGDALRLRHLGAGDQRARGRAVDLLRLPRRDQAAERRRHVRRAGCPRSGTSTSSATCARAC